MGFSSINHPAIGVSTILGTTHTYISSKSANLCCKSSLWKDNEFCSGGKWNNKYNSYGWMRRTNVIMIISGNIPWHGQIKPLWMPKPLSLPYPFLSIQNTKKQIIRISVLQPFPVPRSWSDNIPPPARNLKPITQSSRNTATWFQITP